MRRAAKSDASQAPILEGLRAAGYQCWVIEWPDDILVWHPRFGANWFRVISAKTPDAKGRIKERKDQPEQNAFVAMTGVPRVGTPEHAIAAMEAP